MLRAAGMISEPVAKEEEWRGITQLLFLERLARNLDAELPARGGGRWSASGPICWCGRFCMANATAAASASRRSRGQWMRLRRACLPVPAAAAPVQADDGRLPAGSPPVRGESLVASASVGYVARALPGFRFEHPLNGPVAVLGHLLSTGYLWEKVRMEGGAYGAFSYPRNMDGLFLLGSYRDPNITATLRAFNEGLKLMESGPLDKRRGGQGGHRHDRAGGPADRPGRKGFRLHAEEAAWHHRRGPPGPPHLASRRGAAGYRRGGPGAHPGLIAGIHGGHRQPPLPAGSGGRRCPSSAAGSPIFRNRER